jgi:hypothetical protein
MAHPYVVIRYECMTPVSLSRRIPEVRAAKRYTYQALVTLYPGSDKTLLGRWGAEPHRMVVRGRSAESGHSQFFNALVSCEDNAPFRPGNPRVLVTLRVVGDDIAQYLGIGEHFNLWLGNDIGEGVITRRLFV